MLATNEVLGAKMLAANEISNDSSNGDRLSNGTKRVELKAGTLEGQITSKSQKSAKFLKLSKSENLKGKKLAKFKKPSESRNLPNFDAKKAGLSFLTPKARSAFNGLRLAFTKAPILQHFDPECHIWINTNALRYAICGILSQLASGTSSDGVVSKTNLGQWHLIAFFSRKMFPAETRYEIHNGELLAIVEAFKTWHHYLESCKYEVFVLTDHNNFRCFMDTKSLSSRQVRWVQELSWLYFRIDYCQGKANAATDAMSKFLQRSQDKENKLQAENGQILYWLQTSLTNVNLAGLSLFSRPSHLHQVFFYETYILLQLRQFWNSL